MKDKLEVPVWRVVVKYHIRVIRRHWILICSHGRMFSYLFSIWMLNQISVVGDQKEKSKKGFSCALLRCDLPYGDQDDE